MKVQIHALTVASSIVLFAQGEVTVKDDRTWIRVKISDNVVLKCCYEDTDKPSQVKLTWVNVVKAANNTYAKQLVERSHVIKGDTNDNKFSKEVCGTLEFTSVRLNDTGLYQCRLDGSRVYHTHGTYLQVYSKCVYLFGGGWGGGGRLCCTNQSEMVVCVGV